MGLDYLNKKTWHTGSIQNIEKVWLKEQEERDRLKKIEEKTKRLIEERHNEELKRLQVQAGLINQSQLDRMEWMYDGGYKMTENQKTNEEYLLGKPVEEIGKNAWMPTISKEEITNQKCEDFSKLNEDPLFQIRQKEEQRKQEIRDNPLEIQRLLKMIEDKKLEKQRLKKEKKDKKKEKKRLKKEKKSKKSKKIKKSKKSKDRSRSRTNSSRSKSNSSDSSSRSTSPTKSSTTNLTQMSTKSATSQFYEQYMTQRLGSIMTQDEDGKLRMDFGLQKRLNKQKNAKNVDARPMTEDEKNKLREEMKQNAIKLKNDKMAQHQKDYEEKMDTKKGNFLQKARDQIYNSNEGDLADRISRNKNRYQRFTEDEK